MIIRKLTPADYHGMLVLYRELDQFHVDARPDFFVRQEDVFPQEAFEANMINPECLMLGAFDEPDNMIGLVRATLWKESGMVKTVKVVCLDDVYVVPEYRRDGIATKLFEAVEQWAREQGAARCNCPVSRHGHDTAAVCLREEIIIRILRGAAQVRRKDELHSRDQTRRWNP